MNDIPRTPNSAEITDNLVREWQARLDAAVLAERNRIVNMFMIMHESAKGSHNYWHVAANLVQADVASDT
jgi:hypothetical protein